ncbi:hypothetical protein EJ05DRAFT_482491 [Pseudovirgaria hyperparasitica]|uniref:Uncharacterized protein n=1 Tax=Pseudovirgaria hyperparasitica TaxID=470096 RepID=A0A6A6WFN7_9PEZI|nr:uncharacterized protein EJ05DRAFT_482491 [Pseudovirgaria hyperparasitica]KAF2761638.1 hypothetical protein EJ05DRAFT_482491 [Pseudovirgaria hyperparasitica]
MPPNQSRPSSHQNTTRPAGQAPPPPPIRPSGIESPPTLSSLATAISSLRRENTELRNRVAALYPNTTHDLRHAQLSNVVAAVRASITQQIRMQEAAISARQRRQEEAFNRTMKDVQAHFTRRVEGSVQMLERRFAERVGDELRSGPGRLAVDEAATRAAERVCREYGERAEESAGMLAGAVEDAVSRAVREGRESVEEGLREMKREVGERMAAVEEVLARVVAGEASGGEGSGGGGEEEEVVEREGEGGGEAEGSRKRAREEEGEAEVVEERPAPKKARRTAKGRSAKGKERVEVRRTGRKRVARTFYEP